MAYLSYQQGAYKISTKQDTRSKLPQIDKNGAFEESTTKLYVQHHTQITPS